MNSEKLHVANSCFNFSRGLHVCCRVERLLETLGMRANQPVPPASILVVGSAADKNVKAAESTSSSM